MAAPAPPWTTPKAPWLHVVPSESGLGAEPSIDGGLVRVLDARRMETVAGVFDEFRSAFEFPDYFGRNWDALDECICDLEWLPASSYRIVIESASRLLDRGRAERSTFLNLMSDAGKAWASAHRGGRESPGRAIPFNTVLLGASIDWCP
ncbi:barstar family protein [Geodermatophilus nigrescens]